MIRSPREQILEERVHKAEVLTQLMIDTEKVCKNQTPEARAAVVSAAQLLIQDIDDDKFNIIFKPEDDWHGGSILHVYSALGFCQVYFKADGTLKEINTAINSRIRGVIENLEQLKLAIAKCYEKIDQKTVNY